MWTDWSVVQSGVNWLISGAKVGWTDWSAVQSGVNWLISGAKWGELIDQRCKVGWTDWSAVWRWGELIDQQCKGGVNWLISGAKVGWTNWSAMQRWGELIDQWYKGGVKWLISSAMVGWTDWSAVWRWGDLIYQRCKGGGWSRSSDLNVDREPLWDITKYRTNAWPCHFVENVFTLDYLRSKQLHCGMQMLKMCLCTMSSYTKLLYNSRSHILQTAVRLFGEFRSI